MGTVSATLAGRTGSLHSDDDRILSWTERYLGTWWHVRRDHSRDVAAVILADVDHREYEALRALVDEDPEPVETLIRTPGVRRTVDGVRYAYAPSRSVGTRYDPTTGVLRIVGADVEQTMLDASRFLRNHLADLAEADGWSVLHAACVDTPAGAYLLLGQKGAGKTTTSLTLASAWKAPLVANDRCLVRVIDDRIEVLPWPGSISLGFGLLRELGWFDTVSEAVRNGHPQHPFQDPAATEKLLSGSRSAEFADNGREIKAEIMPHDLTEWFGIETGRSAQVSGVLFPRVRPDSRQRIERVSEGREAFVEHVLESESSGYPDYLDMRHPLTELAMARRAALLDRLSGVPQARVHLGHDVLENATFLAADNTLPR